MSENIAEQLSEKQAAFSETVYNEINKVIGGNNPDQMLTLLLPGIGLTKSDYEYDVTGMKDTVVEANESRLANKLYDPYTLNGTDNGLTLPNQYKTALNMLTPKLNTNIANAKERLRDLLLSKYPELDETLIHSFQDKYFDLYKEYLEVAKQWAKDQVAMKKELYYDPIQNGTATEREAYDRYLTEFQTEAETRFNEVNTKMAKVLSVFSPNDMSIIEGILDSGTGAELHEARQTLRNVKKMNPDGGYTYPVNFTPSDWFKQLDRSIPAVDLLQSPTVLKDELGLCYTKQISIAAKIKALGDTIPDQEKLASSAQTLKTKQDAFDKAHDALVTLGESSILNFANEIVSACMAADAGSVGADLKKQNISDPKKQTDNAEESGADSKETADPEKITLEKDQINKITTALNSLDEISVKNETDEKKKELKEQANEDKEALKKELEGKTSIEITKKEETKNSPKTDTTDIIDKVFNVFIGQCQAFNEKQSAVTSALDDYLKALSDDAYLRANAELKRLLDSLTTEKTKNDNRIKELETDIKTAAAINGADASNTSIPEPPEGYTTVTIIHKMSKTYSENHETVDTKTTKRTAGFWIFKDTSKTTETNTEIDTFCEDDNTEIKIAMNIAKVGFDRPWFNPGIFKLTKDMYSYASQKIADEDYGTSGFWLFPKKKDPNDYILPCYPVGMVIARDVTIKITNNTFASKSTIKQAEKTMSQNSSFVFYNKSSGSTHSTNDSGCSTFSDDNSITMRFADPQVIGFYLQMVPADKSDKITLPKNDNNAQIQAENASIENYVSMYKNLWTTKEDEFKRLRAKK